MDREYGIAILLATLAAFITIAGMFVIGQFSIIIGLILYVILQLKFKKYFWKSFIIGAVIGLPLGFIVSYVQFMSMLGI